MTTPPLTEQRTENASNLLFNEQWSRSYFLLPLSRGVEYCECQRVSARTTCRISSTLDFATRHTVKSNAVAFAAHLSKLFLPYSRLVPHHQAIMVLVGCQGSTAADRRRDCGGVLEAGAIAPQPQPAITTMVAYRMVVSTSKRWPQRPSMPPSHWRALPSLRCRTTPQQPPPPPQRGQYAIWSLLVA